MPKSIPKKCKECAYLSIEQVMEVHKDCYRQSSCQPRRSRIRNAATIKERRNTKNAIALDKNRTRCPTSSICNSSGLAGASPGFSNSAIGSSIWDGDTKLAVIEPVHCLGWKPSHAMAYVESILSALSEKYGLKYFSEEIVIPPAACSIENCPSRIYTN
ncbi:MAG: hypothetical protein HC778_02230 [Chamaesiphon sp. CSU_1_12]|nr:hypothetical protein [Chamaesiphon sp. CSU_1_12]